MVFVFQVSEHRRKYRGKEGYGSKEEWEFLYLFLIYEFSSSLPRLVPKAALTTEKKEETGPSCVLHGSCTVS
jgi:hypothetical protein